MDNGLVKASAAAAQLGKKPITIRRMIQDGRLSGLKNGSRWWVEQSSIEQFIQSGVAKTDQNGKKTPIETEQSDTIEGDDTQENAKITAKTADYGMLQGEIQQNATQFFDKCKFFSFAYLTILYRCRYYEDEGFDIERLTKTHFTEVRMANMIDLLGDDLVEVIGCFFDVGYFVEMLNINDNDYQERYGIWRTDIHWRLELRDKPNADPVAFSYPFCIAHKDLMGIGKSPQIIDCRYWRDHGVELQGVGEQARPNSWS